MFEATSRPPAALAAALAALAIGLSATPAAASERGLGASLGSAMGAAGSWSGAYVVNADSGRAIFRWSHTTPRILASNTKLFTTAAAIRRSGSRPRHGKYLIHISEPTRR